MHNDGGSEGVEGALAKLQAIPITLLVFFPRDTVEGPHPDLSYKNVIF
jgi:hypothetical protein